MKTVTMTMGLWWITCMPAFAAMNENSIIGCRDTGGSKRGCTVKEFTVLDPVCYMVEGKKECPDLDVTVNYEFACTGHRMDVGIVQANGTKHTLNYGTSSLLLSNVRAPLALRDLDSRTTSRATVNPSCRLVIKGVQASPSISTLEKWIERANARIEALTAAMDAFRLASLYQDVLDVQKAEANSVMELLVGMIDSALLTSDYPEGIEPFLVPGTRDILDGSAMSAEVRAQWDEAQLILPQVMDYYVTWSMLKSTRDGLPSPEVEDESSPTRTMIAISVFYKNRLIRSLTASEKFYDSMAAIRASLKPNLRTTIDRLNELIKKGRTAVNTPTH